MIMIGTPPHRLRGNFLYTLSDSPAAASRQERSRDFSALSSAISFQRRNDFFSRLFAGVHAVGDADAMVGAAGEGQRWK